MRRGTTDPTGGGLPSRSQLTPMRREPGSELQHTALQQCASSGQRVLAGLATMHKITRRERPAWTVACIWCAKPMSSCA